LELGNPIEQSERRFLKFIALPKVRDARMYALCGIEAAVVAAAAAIAFFVRFPTEVAAQNLAEFWWLIPLSVGLRIALFWMFGLYGWVWYYMGVREVRDIAAGAAGRLHGCNSLRLSRNPAGS
jgi:hypothetical protein